MRGLLTISLFSCLLGLTTPTVARADIAVIVHRDSPVRAMSPREVSDLYLGRSRSHGTDEHKTTLSLYEQPAESPLRETFFRTLNGMNLKQLNAYWARLRFSGEVLPPATLPDSRSVLDAVSRNRSAIGYVDAATVNDSVKVILHLKE